MSDTRGYNIDPEYRPNIIKYPKPKSDKQIKKTKFAHGAENNDKVKQCSENQTPQFVPDTNFTLACLVCLCFNFPLGAIAMYLSLSAARLYRDGDVKTGERRAKWSVLLSLFSIVSTVLVVTAMVLWVVVADQNERELQQRPT